MRPASAQGRALGRWRTPGSNRRGRFLISCLIRCTLKRSDPYPAGVNRNPSADCSGFCAQDFRHQLHFNIKSVLIPAPKSPCLFLLGSLFLTSAGIWILSVGTVATHFLGSPPSATATESGPELASATGAQLTGEGLCAPKSQTFPRSSSSRRSRGTGHTGQGSGRETALVLTAMPVVLHQGHSLAQRALTCYSTSRICTNLFTQESF